MNQNHEIFTGHLRTIFGTESSIHKADAEDGRAPISIFIYRNIPEAGMITGITYGLSIYPYAEWKLARPEIIVAVKSLNIGWPCAAATFAATYRGKKPFSYGDVFTTDIPMVSDSKMEGFLIFAQSILDKSMQTIQMYDYKIHFTQFYPIYRSEVDLYEKIGLKSFWHHPGFDMYDIKRKPIA
jgi:hypothetical protein